MNYKKYKTTYEVWSAIKQAHPDLVVFGSYSAPEYGRMETSYGFKGDDYPIIEARTTWDIDMEKSYERHNEQHEYWLCVGIVEED